MPNIIEEIQDECSRIRKKIPAYEEAGEVGAFGAIVLKKAVKDGEAAIASGNYEEMFNALLELRGCRWI